MASGLSAQQIGGITPVAPAVSLLTSGARPLPAGIAPPGGLQVPGGDEPVGPSASGNGKSWKSGITWRQAPPATGHRRVYCGVSTLELPEVLDTETFFPYTVYVPYLCDWVTDDVAAELETEAVTAAEAETPWLVSREVWTGETDTDNPSLQSAATDVSLAAAAHPVPALGVLLSRYLDCTQRGGPVLHVPALFIPSLFAHGVIKQSGDAYYGPLGSIVSPGPGYPNDGTGTFGPKTIGAPLGEVAGAGNGWIYVSGPVEYAATPPVVPLGGPQRWWDRRTNRYELLAERQVIHRFDTTCVFAVKTFLPTPTVPEEA